MAERRMFSRAIAESDCFLEMPLTAQSLYFHLGLNGDDDGFVSSPRRIMRMIGAADDDLKLLIAKGFVLSFNSGIIVIRHWNLNNYIQKDRYKPSIYTTEKEMITGGKSKPYEFKTEPYTSCIQDGSSLDVECSRSIEENSIDKISIGGAGGDPAPKRKRFTRPQIEEIEEYITQCGYNLDSQRFFDYYESNGWKVGRNPMKDWKAALRGWQQREKKLNEQSKPVENYASGVHVYD